MGKKLRLIALILIIFSLVTSCQSGVNDTGTDAATFSPYQGSREESYYMVAFLKELGFWKKCYKGFEAAAQAHGVRSYYTGADSSSIEQNLEVLKNIITKAPSGIAITCVSPEPYEDLIQKAIASGIHVVTFDSDSKESGRSCFISTGNFAAGQGAAERIQSMTSSANIMLVYSKDLECSMDRIDGFINRIEGNPSYRIIAMVDDKGDLSSGIEGVKKALQDNHGIDTVFCSTGVSSTSAITAIQDLDLKGLHLMTWDVDNIVLDAIETGLVESTVAQGMYSMGYWSMEVLYTATHQLTENRLPEFIDTGYEFVTKKNASLFR